MTPWHRVFGTSDSHPDPAALLAALRARGLEVTGHFRGDEQGWFGAALILAGAGGAVEVECYLSAEEGIRHELNSWAAWLEAAGEGAEQTRLMQHMISTTRLFTIRPADDADAHALCVALCELLAGAIAGVYQIDGRGFFAADGTLLLPED
jgi:hypothetical protein